MADKKQRMSPDAIARIEMAKEKARISGKRPQRVSRLEQAMEEREREQEVEKRTTIHREGEIPMISLCQMPLETVAEGGRKDTEVVWKAYKPPEAGKKNRVRLNAAAIGALAMRLKAVEWARAMGKGVRQDSLAQRLEREASL